jgi:hypothetical protein
MDKQQEAEIYLHFTNHRVSWGGKAPFKSTGFVEDILKNGLRPFANVGCGDVVQQLVNFVHHGCRTNKKRVKGIVSVPAVIVIDGTGLRVQQGYDAHNHLQINQPVSPDRILGWFEWDPDNTLANSKDTEYQICSLRAGRFNAEFRAKVQEVVDGV